jgi:uncharacterized protein
MSAKFEINKSKDGQYGFKLLASNGKVILRNCAFKSKIDAIRHVELVKKYSACNGNYQRGISSNKGSYFILMGNDGDIIAKSKMYLSITGMEKGIASVKANAGCAEVFDWVVENNKNSDHRCG